MKTAVITGSLFLMLASPVFAEERLACHDEYAEAYNLSMDSFDDPQKSQQAVDAQQTFETCLKAYEVKNGTPAAKELAAKLNDLQP